MDLNKLTIMGRLTAAPELRSTQTGKQVASFSVATSLEWKDQHGNKQSKTTFHNVSAWGKLGETCAQYLVKGQRVWIEGRLEQGKYIDKSNVERTTYTLVASEMIILEKPKGHQDNAAQPQYSPQPAAQPVQEGQTIAQSVANPSHIVSEDEEINVNDIPF